MTIPATTVPAPRSGTDRPAGDNQQRTFDEIARHVAHLAIADRAATAPPRPGASVAELRARFDIGLPDDGRDGLEVLDRLAAAARPGLVGNTGPDFFGWVMGASHPVGVGADWLAAAWGQNAAIYATSPAAAIAEEVVARWLLDLLRLPPESSVGLATGATMASFTCLAAARSEVLRRVGYDLETDGLIGAPPISAFVGEEAHTTIFSGLRYLGFGQKNLVKIASDESGRMRADDLERELDRHGGPKIIVGQAGHINSGAFDPFPEVADLAHIHNAWLHVDGAFGLWARAVPEFDQLCAGVEAADSWAVDGHKWLQVPYDSGFAIVKDERAHKRAMDTSASYIAEKPGDGRNPTQYGPELSRRARGFAAWAVLQALGRNGVADLIRGHCRLARHLKSMLEAEPGVRVMNEVALNQLAIVFEDETLQVEADTLTGRVFAEMQKDNASFVEQASWKGRCILRVSIISGVTRRDHVERLAASIVRAWRRVKGA
jgi:glutamate/tyrosine decarboxylase-like PLP-dependent enzyme